MSLQQSFSYIQDMFSSLEIGCITSLLLQLPHAPRSNSSLDRSDWIPPCLSPAVSLGVGLIHWSRRVMGCPALPFSYDHDVLSRASELGSGPGSSSRSPSSTLTGILR